MMPQPNALGGMAVAPQPQQAGPGPQAGPSPDQNGPSDLAAHIDQNLKQSMATNKALAKQVGQMEALRRELDALLEKGDMLEPEDVIQGAGALVGEGFGTQEVAALLSQAPLTGGGQALLAWVQQEDAQVQQAEAQLHSQMGKAGIHTAIAAMTKLHAMHHMQGPPQAGPMPPQGGPNG